MPQTTTVSLRVRKEIIELVEKMVRCGLAKDRSHALNILIERGLGEVQKEVEFWERVNKELEKLRKTKPRIRHGKLTDLIEEERRRT